MAALYAQEEIVPWLLERIREKNPDAYPKKSLYSRLHVLRNGHAPYFGKRPDGEGRYTNPTTAEPKLILGKHWRKIGQAVVYTEAGRKKLLELFDVEGE